MKKPIAPRSCSAAALRTSALPGLLDAIAGARTLFCAFRPERLAYEELARVIDSGFRQRFRRPEPREHRIPVLYGGAGGPDLRRARPARRL